MSGALISVNDEHNDDRKRYFHDRKDQSAHTASLMLKYHILTSLRAPQMHKQNEAHYIKQDIIKGKGEIPEGIMVNSEPEMEYGKTRINDDIHIKGISDSHRGIGGELVNEYIVRLKALIMPPYAGNSQTDKGHLV